MFDMVEAFLFGWSRFKKHFLFIWLMLVVSIAVSFSVQVIGSVIERTDFFLLTLVFGIVSMAVSLLISLGTSKIYLDVADTDTKTDIKDLFSQHTILVRFFLATVLFSLMMFLGLILLVIPGVYLFTRYQFFMYLMIDKRLGVMDAFSASSKMTEGVKWNLLGFFIVAAILNVLGALALFIGLAVTAPVTAFAYAHVYRVLSRRLEPESGEVSPSLAQ